VSIAADSNGIPSSIVFVSFVRVSVSDGKTSLAAGTNKTSSKVRASRICVNGRLLPDSMGWRVDGGGYHAAAHHGKRASMWPYRASISHNEKW
jgi:hypothetical protein